MNETLDRKKDAILDVNETSDRRKDVILEVNETSDRRKNAAPDAQQTPDWETAPSRPLPRPPGLGRGHCAASE
ncbi:MAG: hypothetical protein GY719_18670 [bacterium]|nr:hypothetical protein [bacterium]